MSSLRKLFARVRSFLTGALHDIEEVIAPQKNIIHLQCATHPECQDAVDSIRESLEHHNVTVLVDGTHHDPRVMLCVRATEHSLREAIELLQKSVIVSFEPYSEAREELGRRQLLCDL